MTQGVDDGTCSVALRRADPHHRAHLPEGDLNPNTGEKPDEDAAREKVSEESKSDQPGNDEDDAGDDRNDGGECDPMR